MYPYTPPDLSGSALLTTLDHAPLPTNDVLCVYYFGAHASKFRG